MLYLFLQQPYWLCPECRVCACCKWGRCTHVTYYTILCNLAVWVRSCQCALPHGLLSFLLSAILSYFLEICILVLLQPLFVWCHVSVLNTIAQSACLRPQGPEPLHISESCPPPHLISDSLTPRSHFHDVYALLFQSTGHYSWVTVSV